MNVSSDLKGINLLVSAVFFVVEDASSILSIDLSDKFLLDHFLQDKLDKVTALEPSGLKFKQSN